MAELATSTVRFVDGDQSVDLGTATVQPSLGIDKLQAVVADRAPTQISARPRRARRVPLDVEASDLAAREGSGCYVQAALRRSRRSRRDKRHHQQHQQQQQPEKTILLKRLPPTDLAAAPLMLGAWDYQAQLRELQRHREWYLINTAPPDPYFALAHDVEGPTPRPTRCRECEAAAAAMRDPAFHCCVRDAVTVGFRSPVGPIQRPPKKSPAFLGVTPVY